jgi:hypothetical protein
MEAKINPPQMIDKKKYGKMTPQDQEEYVEKKIKQILHLNGDGITVPEICEIAPFTRPTIIKHLERLAASREAYKIKRRKITMYYPNGRIVHPEAMIKVENDTGGIFRGTFLNNNFGAFIYLEEINEKNITGGGMLISLKSFDSFKELVDRIEKKKITIENG